MILTLNVGSSSIKFALYQDDLVERVRGGVDQIAGPQPEVRFSVDGGARTTATLPAGDHAALIAATLDLVRVQAPGAAIDAVGHRIVHGGADFVAPCILNEQALVALAKLEPLAPLHQPHNLAGVRAAQALFPAAIQVGCFDTSFHRGQPRLHDLFALPRAYFDAGVRRYGFHGLSYEYIAGALAKDFPAEASGRCVLAHLGSGASMCALNAGRSVGSTMGFSALDGMPMGARCGRIDPGVLLWMMREQGMDADAIEAVLYKESGLKGLSGLSGDMRALEAAQTPEAAEAIAYFVMCAQREIGGLTALLGGLDAIVFTGGIGENAVRARAAICEGLRWLGLELDPARNAAHGPRITGDSSRVAALVIPTNEEWMIARHTQSLAKA
jgi:acetate kinase